MFEVILIDYVKEELIANFGQENKALELMRDLAKRGYSSRVFSTIKAQNTALLRTNKTFVGNI